MKRWKTRHRTQKNLDIYMDIVEARNFFKSIKEPDFKMPGTVPNYFPHNYERYLAKLENGNV